MIEIVDLSPALASQAAEILVLAFRAHWPEAWPTLAEGLAEVNEILAPERIARAAVDETGRLLGWIGGLPQYDGHVWELHPLAVHPNWQRRGIGRGLVSDFETHVRARGGLTITLGTDDENGMTTLADADLYEDLWAKVAAIRDLKGHPFVFYQKCGYRITGVVPDANGRGKPDILMSKRVG